MITDRSKNTEQSSNNECVYEDINYDALIRNKENVKMFWIFTPSELRNTPNMLRGMSPSVELYNRQTCAVTIMQLGHSLSVSQLCINTGIVYMHRFFTLYRFDDFDKYMVSSACLFLACKVEEQPRRLESVVSTLLSQDYFRGCLSGHEDPVKELSELLILHEECLIQMLGFNLRVHHPHPIIVKTSHLVKAPRELAKTAYLLATNSLILTTFCLQYPHDLVASFCIYLACMRHKVKIPISTEGQEWFHYVNTNIEHSQLEALSREFLRIYRSIPDRIRSRLCAPEIRPHAPTPVRNENLTTSSERTAGCDSRGFMPGSNQFIKPSEHSKLIRQQPNCVRFHNYNGARSNYENCNSTNSSSRSFDCRPNHYNAAHRPMVNRKHSSFSDFSYGRFNSYDHYRNRSDQRPLINYSEISGASSELHEGTKSPNRLAEGSEKKQHECQEPRHERNPSDQINDRSKTCSLKRDLKQNGLIRNDKQPLVGTHDGALASRKRPLLTNGQTSEPLNKVPKCDKNLCDANIPSFPKSEMNFIDKRQGITACRMSRSDTDMHKMKSNFRTESTSRDYANEHKINEAGTDELSSFNCQRTDSQSSLFSSAHNSEFHDDTVSAFNSQSSSIVTSTSSFCENRKKANAINHYSDCSQNIPVNKSSMSFCESIFEQPDDADDDDMHDTFNYMTGTADSQQTDSRKHCAGHGSESNLRGVGNNIVKDC